MKTNSSVIAAFLLIAILFSACAEQKNQQKTPTDSDVIKQLYLAGSDISKPHQIDFYIYVPTEDSANRIASLIIRKGFKAKVKPAAMGPGWLALISKEVIPTEKALTDLRREFTAFALSEHGEYDGWEAKVIKNSTAQQSAPWDRGQKRHSP